MRRVGTGAMVGSGVSGLVLHCKESDGQIKPLLETQGKRPLWTDWNNEDDKEGIKKKKSCICLFLIDRETSFRTTVGHHTIISNDNDVRESDRVSSRQTPPPPLPPEIPRRSPSGPGGRWRARYCRHVGSPLTNRTHLLPSFVRLGGVRGRGSGRGWCQSLKGFFQKRKKEKKKKQKKEEEKKTPQGFWFVKVKFDHSLNSTGAWRRADGPPRLRPRPARRRKQGQDTNFSPSRPVTEHQGWSYCYIKYTSIN